jgi:hypothetical protein
VKKILELYYTRRKFNCQCNWTPLSVILAPLKKPLLDYPPSSVCGGEGASIILATQLQRCELFHRTPLFLYYNLLRFYTSSSVCVHAFHRLNIHFFFVLSSYFIAILYEKLPHFSVCRGGAQHTFSSGARIKIDILQTYFCTAVVPEKTNLGDKRKWRKRQIIMTPTLT